MVFQLKFPKIAPAALWNSGLPPRPQKLPPKWGRSRRVGKLPPEGFWVGVSFGQTPPQIENSLPNGGGVNTPTLEESQWKHCRELQTRSELSQVVE